MTKGLSRRLRRLEGGLLPLGRTMVVSVPYQMDSDTALARLGIKPEEGVRLILVTDFAAEEPQLVSSAETRHSGQ